MNQLPVKKQLQIIRNHHKLVAIVKKGPEEFWKVKKKAEHHHLY